MKRIFQAIDRIEHFALVWTILGLAGIGFVQVFTRYLFEYSFTWFEEAGRFLGVFIAFLGAGIGAKKGTHFTMDLIVRSMNRPMRKITLTLVSFLSGGFFFLISFYSIKMVIRMYGFHSTSATLGIPMYIVYLPIPFFSIVMGIRFLEKGVGFLKALGKNSEKSLEEKSS